MENGYASQNIDPTIPAKDLGLVGLVARFKPVTDGHVAMLRAVCSRADHVLIGIGTLGVGRQSDLDYRNPFTTLESQEMIDLALKSQFSNYRFLEVPDLHNGPRWREQALGIFGQLDHFVTANSYVASLLKDDYKVIHPVTLIPASQRTPISGTMVRTAIAMGQEWENMVPSLVAGYIREKNLDKRLVQCFGLEILADNAYCAIHGDHP